MVERLLNQRQRKGDVALRQPHQRQAGLRIPAALLRLDEGRFRAREVALSQTDAAKLGQRPAELAPEVRPRSEERRVGEGWRGRTTTQHRGSKGNNNTAN